MVKSGGRACRASYYIFWLYYNTCRSTKGGKAQLFLKATARIMKHHFIFSLAVLLLVGCQGRVYTFRPVETISNDPGHMETIHPIESEITFAGVTKHEGDIAPIAKFKCKFTNAGSTPVKLNPYSYNLIDDDANHFEPILHNTSETILLYPQSSTNFTLTYSFPPGYDLKKVGSFRLTWNYDIDGVEYRRLTKFVKREVEYRTRYYGAAPYYYYYPGFYSSFHFGGHRRYGRFRTGFGFGFGSGCY